MDGQTRAQNIGLGLQGFAAGVQGQLPQFGAQLNQMNQLAQQAQERQQKMAIERQKTLFTDANAALNLLNDGNLDGVKQIGMNRLQLLRNFPDADPSDTQRLVQLAMAASNGSEEAEQLLRGELESAVEIGKSMGILEPTPPTKLNLVQRIRPDGSAQTLNTDDYGNFYDMAGNVVELTSEDRVLESATISGTPDEYGLSDREGMDMDNKEIATRNMINLAGDAISMLSETPDLNTLTARTASTINNLQQEFSAIARVWSGDEFDESLLDPSNAEYTEEFDRLGIDNNRMRSLITSMAYARAAAREQGGRFSDRDIRAAIEEIGGGASDPRAFAEVIRDVAARAARDFETTFEVKTKEPYRGDLGLDSLTPNRYPTVQSQEDFDELPSGAIFIEDGVQYRKP